jgi:GTPase
MLYLEKLREALKVRKERAILVGACIGKSEELDGLVELESLAQTAGAVVVYKFQQKIRKINPSTYIGKGKAEQLKSKAKQLNANIVIFDNDLTPGQIRELEKYIEVMVIDRSELILDIFATRAQTKQAILQVELAQLEYTYPRLTRMWSHLDTVAGAGGGTTAGAVGAIGTRGPGEQQLEIDRRLVSKRITELKRDLEEIDERKIREIAGRKGLFKICIVGYTNAGKSTLMNALTNADVFVENRLFATLDTRTRRWTPAKGLEMLLSDTVGFVRKLPHQLVASFKATLEEAVNADLLLHVIDASSPDALNQIDSVNSVLGEIGCAEKPMLKVLNKVDALRMVSDNPRSKHNRLVQDTASGFDMLQTLHPDAVSISAKTGFGIDKLCEAVIIKYKGGEVLVRLTGSIADGRIRSFLLAHGEIIIEKYSDISVLFEARLGKNQLPELYHLHPQTIEIIE